MRREWRAGFGGTAAVIAFIEASIIRFPGVATVFSLASQSASQASLKEQTLIWTFGMHRALVCLLWWSVKSRALRVFVLCRGAARLMGP